MQVLRIPEESLGAVLAWSNGPHRLIPIETPHGHIVSMGVVNNPAYAEIFNALPFVEVIEYEPEAESDDGQSAG